MCAESIGSGRKAAGQKVPDLVNQSGSEVRLGPFGDATVELIARRVEGQDSQPARAFVWLRAIRFLVHNRPSRLQKDFDSARDAGPIARIKVFGCRRIDPAQESMDVFSTVLFANSVET